MASAIQNYTISEDIPAGKVDTDRLTQEIRLSAIETALDGILVSGDVCTVKFKADLSAAGKTILDNDASAPCGGLMGAHSGEPLDNPITKDGIPIVHINSPIVEGNTPVIASNTWPIEHNVIWCGEGDDIDNGAVGGGQEFRISLAAAGDASVESQFVEVVRLGGGHVYWKNCAYGDYASFVVIAPATSNIVSNVGLGAYSKLDIGGGINMMVTPGVPGAGPADWDIDLAEKLNANVDFTKAVPVPAIAGDGFFTYDPGTDSLTYTPGVGTYNLFDADLNLTMFIRKLWLLEDGCCPLTVYDNVPAAILPQWRFKVLLHRAAETGEDRQLVWSTLISRVRTI